MTTGDPQPGPLVSVVLPTFNRRHFLPDAVDSINAQTYANWELIIMDDGSTDGTDELIDELRGRSRHGLHYHRHDNAGPAVTRNRGVDRATGEYVAFFDSDDLWKPHHLAACVDALEACPDVGWVVGAGERVEKSTGKVLRENSLQINGKDRRFTELHYRTAGDLRVIDDARLLEWITGVDHFGGLQASVIRREVFERVRIPEARIGEDFGFAVRYAAAGLTYAYFPQVHVTYRVHDDHLSAAGDASPEKRLKAAEEYIRLIKLLLREPGLTPVARRALRRKLARHYLWQMGLALEESGRMREARRAIRRGLRYDPMNLSYWKTLLGAHLRH